MACVTNRINNRKDELYNDVVADMIHRDLVFHKCVVDDEGAYIVQTLQEKVENITAPDDRRHGEAHISRWISLDELVAEAANDCPEGTLIPSKSLVRLQFTPRNRRQLRVSHQDAHYCAAQLKYMKSKLVELGPKALLLCCDDKAKVPVGDPGVPVSTGVRGKKTISPVAETLVACDHDMTKSSLCPSVYLESDTPTEIKGSLVRGQVNVIVNDSSWMEKHCRERHYNFQIRKCEDPACCSPSTVPREFLDWLPDPVLDGDTNHYKQYDQLKGIDTTEDSRPSYQKPVLDDTQAGKKKKARKQKSSGNLCNTNPPVVSAETEDATNSEQPTADAPALTAQTARD
ncbi:hypothetical protein MAR_022419 [Mya arenaria]|uniref:Uncharacterized protein n=1 Tax=Mya arenaria TaxID=6604 RepID=A0ABY7DN69_MYAAR|nr:hypothetical protein MAR_022419 [Mya arenaria]